MANSKFSVGDRVKIKDIYYNDALLNPRHGWGGMEHHQGEVGTIKKINDLGWLYIHFPSYDMGTWTGRPHEVERAEKHLTKIKANYNI